jgi:lysozyme
MKTSDRGIYAIALHEGIVPAPYLDSVGVLTWGIGHTASAGAPDPAKLPRGNPENVDAVLPEVFEVFRRDLAKFEARVKRAVKVPLKQHEFDALVSFDFNTGGIQRAKLTEHLNNGDKAAAARGFMGWLRPPEIRSRRESEMRLFRDGVYPSGLVSVFGVTASDKPDFRQVRKRLTQDQVLAHMRGGPVSAPRAPAAPDPAEQPRGFWAWLLSLFGGRK